MNVLKFLFPALLFLSYVGTSQNYKIVDTNQEKCYNATIEITVPASGEAFYGQDAQYNGHQPSYTDNGDGTITDNVTGLMWVQTSDMDGDGDIDYDDKMSYEEAMTAVDTFSLGGYNDWRVPNIKEAYSLIMFSGLDVSGYEGSVDGLTPFINTEYFDFGYGDVDAGERIIDAQFATSTLYVSTTMGGAETMFGTNLADGRIKGYPTEAMPGQTEGKQFYVMFVRGNTNYGINDFQNNGDGTITDNATGLMWSKTDNGEAILWEDALNYAENATLSGYDDWRLPNTKELQSIVDYTRSPATTNSAAIDPAFECSEITDEGASTNYPFYWSSTTHANYTNESGSAAAYVAFGEALGWMEDPQTSDYTLMDVHGAGAQRSDPKTGNPEDYPYGHGPQGDVIRIYNYVRLVRNTDGTGLDEKTKKHGNINIYPNPAKNHITVNSLNVNDKVINIFDITGKKVEKTIITSDSHKINISSLPKGVYILQCGTSTGRFIKQ